MGRLSRTRVIENVINIVHVMPIWAWFSEKEGVIWSDASHHLVTLLPFKGAGWILGQISHFFGFDTLL